MGLGTDKDCVNAPASSLNILFAMGFATYITSRSADLVMVVGNSSMLANCTRAQEGIHTKVVT